MQCPTDKDVEQATNVPGTFSNNRNQQTESVDNAISEALAAAAARTDRNLAEQQLAVAPATAQAPTGIPPTKGEEKLARAAAKRVIKFQNLAKDAQDKVWNAFDYAMTAMTGASKIANTFWMNFQNAMNKFFVNARSDMLLFGNLYAHEKGRLSIQNRFNQAFLQMIPRIRGLNQIFTDRHEKLTRTLVPYMRRTGHSTLDIAEAGGYYLTALHAPENNAHLLAKWKAKVQENDAAMTAITQKAPPEKWSRQTRQKFRELNKENKSLIKRINNLEANLDSLDPPKHLVHGGYTNAQAEALKRQLEKTYGLSSEEFEGIARKISDEFHFITEELIKAGAVPPEQVAAFPKFKWYAPMMSRKMNMVAVANDATHYTPGARHATEGMTEAPDSAFSSLGFAARRAATEIGMQDFGHMLAALERRFNRVKDNKPDWESPILSFNEGQLHGIIRNGTRDQKEVANSILNNNGMVVNVPVTDKNGRRSFERRYYWFNPKLEDGQLTGRRLNEALSSNYKLGSKLTQAMATATSYYGQGFTRFSPGFAPVAGIRDLGERAFHMASRIYYSADGQKIEGSSVVGRYTRNIPRAGQMLYEALRGKATEGSQTAQYYDEYRRWGLLQKFTPGVKQEPKTIEELAKATGMGKTLRNWNLDTQAGWLEGKNLRPMKRVLNESGVAGKAALRTIDGYNDWFQNIPAFSHYITLREAGLAPREAAYGVREIIDMSQTGTIAQHLAVIAPFVRPTMQGAAAFARSMGLGGRNMEEIIASGKKGWMHGLAASAAFGVLYPLARMAMGKDETGRSRMDSLPISRLTNFYPVPIDDEGSYIKVPQGFGPIRVAAALALSMDRVFRGIMDPSDAAFEVLFAAARDSVPGNNPMFNFGDKPAEFVAHYICPAPLKPFMELATNTNAFGSKVHGDVNSEKAAAEQGFKTTPAIWHRVANYIHKTTGADFTPEAYRHLAQGLSFGPLRMITSGIVNFAEAGEPHRGMHKPTAMEAMGPALATLGGTLWYGKIRDTSQHYYYQAASELMAKAKRAGVDMTQDGKKGEEAEAIVKAKLEASDLDSDDIDDILRLRAARKQLLKFGHDFNTQHNRWYEEEDAEQLKEDFEKLAVQSEGIYKDFVENSNYYARR